MEDKRKKKRKKLIRKWARLLLAIASSVLLLTQPVFSFPDDIGLENTRTYVMTTRMFEVHHIEFATGMDKLVGSMSVSGLFYGALAILIGCVICTISYSYHMVRILMSSITAFLAGTYYVIMVYYAILLSDNFYMILYPNLFALLPLVVLITMLSIRKETVNKLVSAEHKKDEGLQ
jgi:hypothetical protein